MRAIAKVFSYYNNKSGHLYYYQQSAAKTYRPATKDALKIFEFTASEV